MVQPSRSAMVRVINDNYFFPSTTIKFRTPDLERVFETYRKYSNLLNRLEKIFLSAEWSAPLGKVLSSPDTGRFPGGLASPLKAGRSSYHASFLLAELEQSGVRAENPGHVIPVKGKKFHFVCALSRERGHLARF